MRTKKQDKVNIDQYKKMIADLAKKRNKTPEDEVNLATFRKVVADEEWRLAKATFEAAKKEALIKLLNANGIDTENRLKAILAAAQSVNPGLVPGPAKRKKKAKKNEDTETTTDTPETEIVDTPDNDETETDANEESDETPTDETGSNPTEETTSNESQSTDQ